MDNLKDSTPPVSIESDFAWLMTHLNYSGEIEARVALAKKVKTGTLPRCLRGREASEGRRGAGERGCDPSLLHSG